MEIETKELHMNKLNSYIRIHDNLIPEKALKNFKRFCENDIEFGKATIVKGDGSVEVNEKVRNVEYYSCSNLADPSFSLVHWSNYISYMVNEKIKEYTKVLEINMGVIINDIQILKYVPGGFYEFHIDHGTSTPRTLSMIYFVNDDYEGGELHFKLWKEDKIMKIEKKSNRLIIWPSNFMYPHAVQPVTKGTRYSVVLWAL
jgi:hypothetical protein